MQVGLDLAHRHTARIERQNAVVEAAEPAIDTLVRPPEEDPAGLRYARQGDRSSAVGREIVLLGSGVSGSEELDRRRDGLRRIRQECVEWAGRGTSILKNDRCLNAFGR